MALKLVKKPATGTTTKQIIDKKSKEIIAEDNTQEPVAVPEETTKPVKEAVSSQLCEVGVEASYTHNLGNYQSARVQVSLRIPCQHAEIDAVYEYGQEWVNHRLSKMVEDLQA